MTKARSEAVRKRQYRERLKAAKALGLQARADPPIPFQKAVFVPGHVPDIVSGHLAPGDELLQGLQTLAADESVSGQARVSAARAVLEAQGVLGKHASGPRDKAPSIPPGLLTREGLVRELARLRRSILPGTRGQVPDTQGDGTP